MPLTVAPNREMAKVGRWRWWVWRWESWKKLRWESKLSFSVLPSMKNGKGGKLFWARPSYPYGIWLWAWAYAYAQRWVCGRLFLTCSCSFSSIHLSSIGFNGSSMKGNERWQGIDVCISTNLDYLQLATVEETRRQSERRRRGRPTRRPPGSCCRWRPSSCHRLRRCRARDRGGLCPWPVVRHPETSSPPDCRSWSLSASGWWDG